MHETGVTLLVEVEHVDGGSEERLEPRDIVTHVVGQLSVARRVRAVRLVDQHPSVGRPIEYDNPPPWRRQRLVVAEHALPCRPRMRRLDQRVSEIAKLSFVVGELEL